MTEPHLHNPRRGFALALAGTLCVGTYFVAAKYALRGFGLPTFCVVWAFASAVASFALVMGRGRLGEVRLAGRPLARMVALGLVAGVGGILLYSALCTLDAAFASFVARFQPVMVILLGAVVLRERLRAAEFAPLAVMFLGGIVSVWGRWQTVGPGVLILLAAYACYAVQHLLSKMESRRVPAEVQMLYRSVLVLCVVGAWALIVDEWTWDAPAGCWIAAVVGAAVSSSVGNLLVFHAFRWWELSRVTMVTMAQPLAVLPMSALVFRRLPAPQELLGGTLILAGAAAVVWIHFIRSAHPATEADAEP